MTTRVSTASRPRLITRIPFWGLVAGSLASAGVGGALLADKLNIMTATLTDGTATGVEVYVGQSVAVLGAILVGAGVLGILLALTVATLASLRAHTTAGTPEADIVRDEDAAFGYDRELGYTQPESLADEAEPVGASR
ncbi:dinucleotide-utilizing enzyme [Microbacterium aureliae]